MIPTLTSRRFSRPRRSLPTLTAAVIAFCLCACSHPTPPPEDDSRAALLRPIGRTGVAVPTDSRTGAQEPLSTGTGSGRHRSRLSGPIMETGAGGF